MKDLRGIPYLKVDNNQRLLFNVVVPLKSFLIVFVNLSWMCARAGFLFYNLLQSFFCILHFLKK